MTSVVGYTGTKEEFSVIVNEIKSKLEYYHKLYDIYNNYDGINNLKTINDNAGTAPVVVSKEIIDLLELGKEVYKETNGLTNIAMGSVLKIWHKYREEGINNPEKARLPNMEDLEEAAKHMDISKVIVNTQESTVYLEDTQMALDVGSLAKGYATEEVGKWLKAQGYDNILISVGGNIRAVGTRADGSLWEVGIENPYGEEDYMGIAQIDNASLVVSGNYQRYYTVDGERYHHIINPVTLMPEHYTASVAIICDDSGLADAYTTALFNLPVEEGKLWAEGLPIKAMWMLEDKEIIYYNGFEEMLKK